LLYRTLTAVCTLIMVNSRAVISRPLTCAHVMLLWLQSVPTDADLMQLSDCVRGSYILFERDHKSLVCNVLD